MFDKDTRVDPEIVLQHLERKYTTKASS